MEDRMTRTRREIVVNARTISRAVSIFRAARPAAALGAALLLGLALTACGVLDPVKKVSEDPAVRAKVIEALVSDPGRREEVITRLTAQPADRQAVVDRLLKDEGLRGTLVERILSDDRGKALVAGKVAADDAGAKTFIRMLMTTGVMGASLSQKQADALGYGDAYSYGNRRRTMADLKHLGKVVDTWAQSHGGTPPPCTTISDARTCLGKTLPADQTAGLRYNDAWGAPYMYWTDREGKEYLLLSYASDGIWDGAGRTGPTDDVNCDIVFSNGDFAQWPGSFRKDEIQ
jgi:hypothetical protein